MDLGREAMDKISKALERARRDGAADRSDARRPSASGAFPPLKAQPGAQSGVTDEYFALISEVYLALPKVASRVLMLASATPGEGTSTVARGLAETLAGSGGVEVVLVDANLRAPTLDQVFRVRRTPGLSDHIEGGAALGSCLVETQVPHLTLLPAGKRTPVPPRVLGDPAMERVIAELRGRFAYIIVDAAPVLPWPESGGLSRKVDGTIVVIRAGHTKRELVERAMRLVEDAGGRILGTVLNRRRYYIPRFIYERL